MPTGIQPELNALSRALREAIVETFHARRGDPEADPALPGYSPTGQEV